MRVHNVVMAASFFLTVLNVAACRVGAPPEMADVGVTMIAASATIQVDQRTVDELMLTFHKADDALRRQDLEALMTIYSNNYNYHGIDKPELRNIWQDFFRQYRDFSDTHIFSRIIASATGKPPTADITCTGSVWAVSRLTGRRVNIDSWYGDVHHLVYEEGAWRIIGHAWEAPRDTRYVLSPHPFF
jgi:hypothetical protein